MFLLDAYDNVYVWIGLDARPEEKKKAMDVAVVSITTTANNNNTYFYSAVRS